MRAIARLRAAEPELQQVVVKLDAGVSGEGNAIVDLADLPRPGSRYEKHRIGLRFDAMQMEALGVPQSVYLERLSHGGVVEERISGLELRSPSVQLELTPGGEARIVSTHDQILSGQRYLGCRFPAEPAYARAITESARRVGAVLVAAGPWPCGYQLRRRPRRGGRLARVRDRGQPPQRRHHAPAGGARVAFRRCLRRRHGDLHRALRLPSALRGDRPPWSPRLRALGHGGLLRLAALPRLAADGCGVVFHMLSSLDELGRVGLTAIGSTAADAQSRFEHAQALLLDAAGEYAVA